MLTHGPRNVPLRQQTLRGAITWSYTLLTPDEQRLFARLAVFTCRWTLEDAEVVCTVQPSLPFAVVDGVQTLVQSSLLTRVDGPTGQPWFGMLETIYEYASERLAAGPEAHQLRRRHAAHLVTPAEQAQGTDSRAWLERLPWEQVNVRSALDFALQHHEAELALRLLHCFRCQAGQWLPPLLDPIDMFWDVQFFASIVSMLK